MENKNLPDFIKHLENVEPAKDSSKAPMKDCVAAAAVKAEQQPPKEVKPTDN